MSPLALQVYAGLHVPPWQLVEQQSPPNAQTSPSVRHVAPVDPDGSTAHFESAPHTPEQQAPPLAHGWPTWRQTVDEQVPPVQLTEQHCASELQAAPGISQNWAGRHVLPVPHTPEQHSNSVAAVQEPDALHVPEVGAVHVFVPPPASTQLPLQQSGFVLHAPPTAAHCPTGSTHCFAPSAPSHAYVQHSSAVAHGEPTGSHDAGSTHVPLHAPEQHSDGVAHGAARLPHEPIGSTHVEFVQLPEQHSAPWVQLAPSWESAHDGADAAAFFAGEQPTAAPASITVSARMIVRMMSPRRALFPEAHVAPDIFHVFGESAR
jgi:hypothetical protein